MSIFEGVVLYLVVAFIAALVIGKLIRFGRGGDDE